MKGMCKSVMAGMLAIALTVATMLPSQTVYATEFTDDSIEEVSTEQISEELISEEEADGFIDDASDLELPDDPAEGENVRKATSEGALEEITESARLTVAYQAEEDDVTGLPVDENYYRRGDCFTVSETVPKRSGYRFMGWSPIADGAVVYTGGYSFTIEEDLILTAIWETGEEADSSFAAENGEVNNEENLLGISGKEQQVINAVDNYVNSLPNGQLPIHYYNAAGNIVSSTCCAFADYVWEGVYGHSRRQKSNMCTIIDAEGKRDGAGIVQFLDENSAKAGDILFCHDPVNPVNGKYDITHYMIILQYDSDTITFTDGHGVNGHNEVWCNHATVRWDDSTKNHYKYFNGNCFVRLYHVNDDETIAGDTSGPSAPDPIPEPEPGAAVYTGKCGDNLTWTMKSTDSEPNKFKLTISGTGPMYDYVYYKDDEYGVPWIAKIKSLSGYNSFKSLTISEGVTRIGNSAFENFELRNEKLVLPDSLKEIGDEAFRGAGFSGALNLPESVVSIGKAAFYDTDFTGEIDLSNVKKISESAFAESNFSGVILGSGLSEIPTRCFGNCKKLGGTIIIPEGVTKIGKEAFSLSSSSVHTTDLKITIPSTLTEICDYAFSDNRNLTEITPMFPDTIHKIGYGAFEDCTNLAGQLRIPGGMIASRFSFHNCISLTGELSIPSDFWDGTYLNASDSHGREVKRPFRCVPDYCFAGCSGLTGVSFEYGLDRIGECAFYGCTGLSGELKLTSGDIMQQAFMNCTSLTKLTFMHRIPDNRLDSTRDLDLWDGAFEGCTGLTGTLTLYEDDISFAHGDSGARRVFYGTNYDSIHFEGHWTDYYFESSMQGKDARGSYETTLDEDGNWDWQKYEDYPIATFPANAVIYVDDGSFINWGNEIGLNNLRQALENFGYEYKFYSEAGIEHCPIYISEAVANESSVVELGKNVGMTIYKPSYVEPGELDRITITVDHPDIATIEPNEKQPLNYQIVSKSVGTTGYTISINTMKNGIQVASGTIIVVKNSDEKNKFVTGVELDTYNKDITVGDSFTIKATVKPSTAANKNVIWESSDTSVVTVTSSGVVKGVGKGEAKITAITEEGGYRQSCKVEVTSNGYMIHLNGNGADNAVNNIDTDTMDPLYCSFGTKYTLPKNVYTRAGFVFDGWYSSAPEEDEGFGIRLADKASFTDLIVKGEDYDPDADYSMTLYAQWRPEKTYTIAYDANAKKAFGASVLGLMGETTGLAYDDPVYILSCNFRAEGCSFNGWNTRADGSGKEITPEQIRSGQALSLANDLGVAQLTKAGISKTTLYAQWKPGEYKVTFDLNDDDTDTARFKSKTFGSGELGKAAGIDENEALYTFGTAVTKLPTASREGYTFGGWTILPNSKTVLKSISKTSSGNMTVYAKWTPWTYTINYDANKAQGGAKMTVSGKTAKTTACYGETLKLSTNKFVNKGFCLAGWSATKDATVPDAGLSAVDLGEDNTAAWETVLSNEGLKPHKNKDSATLYAVWQLSDYSLAYELSGGDRNESDDNVYAEKYTYGTGLVTSLPTPVRESYKFVGWFSDPDFKKAVKKIDAKTFGDMTLYAKWSTVYKVVLHDVPEAEAGSRSFTGYTFNKAKALPANPYKRTDKAFVGWAATREKALSGEVIYVNKEKITAPDLSKEDDVMVLNLYGVWRSDFAIEADLGGGSYVAGEKNYIPASYTYRMVAAKAITLPTKMIRDGYKFGGWFDRSTNKKVAKITKTTCQDYDIYAKWTALTYKIAFNANPPKGCKAIGKMSTQKMTYGMEEDNPLYKNKFNVNGYIFAGWSLNADGLGDRFEDEDEFNFGEGGYKKKVTLYAVWAKEQ